MLSVMSHLCLAAVQVQGSFAFVIYDEIQKRVFAARDSEVGSKQTWYCVVGAALTAPLCTRGFG
jgi:asparagine synthetase B (glutamine-hydrolysing)